MRARAASASVDVIGLFPAASFVPQGEFNTVPQAKLVVDQAEVVLHYVLGGAERIGDFAVLAAFGYALNDEVFALVGALRLLAVSPAIIASYKVVWPV